MFEDSTSNLPIDNNNNNNGDNNQRKGKKEKNKDAFENGIIDKHSDWESCILNAKLSESETTEEFISETENDIGKKQINETNVRNVPRKKDNSKDISFTSLPSLNFKFPSFENIDDQIKEENEKKREPMKYDSAKYYSVHQNQKNQEIIETREGTINMAQTQQRTNLSYTLKYNKKGCNQGQIDGSKLRKFNTIDKLKEVSIHNSNLKHSKSFQNLEPLGLDTEEPPDKNDNENPTDRISERDSFASINKNNSIDKESSMDNEDDLLYSITKIPNNNNNNNHNHDFDSEEPLNSNEYANKRGPTRNIICDSYDVIDLVGPAGLQQKLKDNKNEESKNKHLIFYFSFIKYYSWIQALKILDFPLDHFHLSINSHRYISNPDKPENQFLYKFNIHNILHKRDSKNYLVNRMLVIVRSVLSRCNGLFLTVMDPTGHIPATIHKEVEKEYKKIINVGATLFLRDVTVFQTLDNFPYLVITLRSLVRVIESGQTNSHIKEKIYQQLCTFQK